MFVLALIIAIIGFLIWLIFFSQQPSVVVPYDQFQYSFMNSDNQNITVNGSFPPNVDRWSDIASKASRRFGVPKNLILAIIWQESSGIAGQVSNAGAYGLMQLKPIAIIDIRNFGYGSFNGWDTDPQTNVMAGTAYLALQLRRTNGNLRQAIKSYYAGYSARNTNPYSSVYLSEVLNKISIA